MGMGSGGAWAIWSLASAGKFFEGMVIFLGGISLPLLAEQFALGGLQRGAITAAGLVGILLGAVLLGALADRLGRRPLFIAAMALLALGLLVVVFSPGVCGVVAGLLLVGLALGADYPIAHLVIAECMPAAQRGRLVLSAFAFQALGALAGTALAALLLRHGAPPQSWRLLYLLPLPAVLLVLIGRWLLPGGASPLFTPPAPSSAPWTQLFRPPLRRATALACLPWFLQDLATYGIGIFLPLLLAERVGDGLAAARGTALIDLMLVAGIASAILLVDRWGRIPLQIVGFLGCAAGLLLAAIGLLPALSSRSMPLLAGGLALFQFMTNLGPNAQTYLLAGELFPTPVRGFGAGLAAAAGKGGAVLTALLGPALLESLGAQALLLLLACTSLLGAAITWACRLETTGIALPATAPLQPST